MALTVTLWHNPRCSKSRQTLQLLENAGHSVNIIRYLETPPNLAEIRTALDKLCIPAIKLMRKNETQFKNLGLSASDPEDTLIAAMATHPILIERPIAFANGKAAIGRPPETVLTLF